MHDDPDRHKLGTMVPVRNYRSGDPHGNHRASKARAPTQEREVKSRRNFLGLLAGTAATFVLASDTRGKLMAAARTRTAAGTAPAASAPVCSWGQPAISHQPPTTTPPTTPTPPPASPTYTFFDEFEGAAGSLPDATKWAWEVGTGASIGGNNETENYVKSPANSFLDGAGHLVIAVTNDGKGGFNSARLHSIFTQQFGHWEAKIACPNVPGCWPAFWFLGNGSWPGCGEIDVMENYGTGFTEGTIWNGNASTNQHGRAQNQMDGGYHVYRMDKSQGSIQLFLDGVLYASATSSNLTPWPFDTNPGYHCILNIATNGTGTSGVNPNPSLVTNAKMLVEYVHCWT